MMSDFKSETASDFRSEMVSDFVGISSVEQRFVGPVGRHFVAFAVQNE
jgi:hypothetical protein